MGMLKINIHNLHTQLIGLSCLIACGGLTSCSQTDSHAANSKQQPTVVVTIPPLQYFVEKIGGNQIEIECLAPASADPETFEPSIAQLRQASDAGLLFTTGLLPFETKIAKSLEDYNSAISIIALSDSIPLIKGTHGDDELDPHIWTSLRNAKIMARQTCRALSAKLPDKRAYFEERLNTLEQHLDSLDTAISQQLAPAKGHSFIVWHPSLSYFARDYELRQLSIGHENKESSLTGLNQRLKQIKKASPILFFYQKELDSRQSQAITEATGLKPVTITPLNPDIESTIISATTALSNATSQAQMAESSTY
jgi:zinc transport system substrate-binding protein